MHGEERRAVLLRLPPSIGVRSWRRAPKLALNAKRLEILDVIKPNVTEKKEPVPTRTNDKQPIASIGAVAAAAVVVLCRACAVHVCVVAGGGQGQPRACASNHHQCAPHGSFSCFDGCFVARAFACAVRAASFVRLAPSLSRPDPPNDA